LLLLPKQHWHVPLLPLPEVLLLLLLLLLLLSLQQHQQALPRR
jgi:hypothetical protein